MPPCAGTTIDGKPCRRVLRAGAAVYCWQHATQDPAAAAPTATSVPGRMAPAVGKTAMESEGEGDLGSLVDAFAALDIHFARPLGDRDGAAGGRYVAQPRPSLDSVAAATVMPVPVPAAQSQSRPAVRPAPPSTLAPRRGRVGTPHRTGNGFIGGSSSGAGDMPKPTSTSIPTSIPMPKPRPVQRRRKKPSRKGMGLGFFCMFGRFDDDEDDDDDALVPRRRTMPPVSTTAQRREVPYAREQQRQWRHKANVNPPPAPSEWQWAEREARNSRQPVPKPHRSRLPPMVDEAPRHQLQHSIPASTSIPSPNPTPVSASASLLSWIPSHLPPETTAALLRELTVPVSDHDEPGFIYLCWVTPTSAVRPTRDAANSLLLGPETTTAPAGSDNHSRRHGRDARGNHPSRVSDVVRAVQPTGPRSGSSNSPRYAAAGTTIMLKIGRSSNVNRRMSQWTRQCAHNLTLVRVYPYPQPQSPPARMRRGWRSDACVGCNVHSQPDDDGGNAPAHIPASTVPYTHKVERLIHLELAMDRVHMAACEHCGRRHQEWFEVRADSTEMLRVDECIRRWLRWIISEKGKGN